MPLNTLRKLPLLLCCVLIFYLSSQQAVSVSEEQAINTFAHKLAHVIEYCILYLFYIVAFIKTPQDKKVLWSGIVFVMLYGISDEIHQAFVPTRGPRVTDVLFDTLGGVIGYVLVQLYLTVSRQK